MKVLEVNHISIVPEENKEKGFLYFHVFSKIHNGKIRKKKSTHIGWLVKNIRCNKWVFAPRIQDNEPSYSSETLKILVNVLEKLNTKTVKYNLKKDEWTVGGVKQ